MTEVTDRALPAPPPRAAVRAAMMLYGVLHAAAERVLPAEVLMMMRIGGFWNTGILHVAARLKIADHPDESRAFAGSMTSLTEQAAPAIVSAYPFGRHALICDVAGGRGTLLAEILAQHVRVRGVLFDEAHVLEAATPYLAKRGVA